MSVTEPTPAPQPETSAKGIRPISMFGTREEKAARFGPPIRRKDLPPRLVSFGRQVRHVPAAGRSQKPRVVEVEAYVDLNNQNNTFVREPGSSIIQPTTIRSGGETEVLDRFTVPGHRRNPVSGNHPAGQADQVIHDPAMSDEARRIAQAMFTHTEGPSDPPPTPAFDPVPW